MSCLSFIYLFFLKESLRKLDRQESELYIFKYDMKALNLSNYGAGEILIVLKDSKRVLRPLERKTRGGYADKELWDCRPLPLTKDY